MLGLDARPANNGPEVSGIEGALGQAMDTAESIAARVSSWLRQVSKENVEATLPELLEVYDDEVVFRDPMQEVHGREAFREMNLSLAARARALSFDVRETATTGDAAFIRWTMRFVPRLGPELHVDGVSFLRVPAGRVVEHVDYWDFANLIASALPGGEGLIRLLFRPFV